ncbi:metal ABC transporter ATP-binding protein [Arcobacter sp. FWKO B]|uniref:metal ABC transporter ATP-binding protein n=1 Tax=Arcobacter sp. FWKO B TaxID=2593672 RepID=UPI0018A5A7E2|nr:ABC transporter ATP-binding protein [Arcobacter sp. FWKO B]QOG12053.1 ABC transporter ATP-binding protein [Arcobacter sp. FWKO B]
MNIIEINNLTFNYDTTVILENITLTIKDNDFLAIIGPNGGGKSTLFRLILGILTPQNGTIKHKYQINEIGYVPQNTNLNLDFPITALEVVLMGYAHKFSLFGYSKEEKEGALSALELVGMGEYANKKIGELSGGQRQRVFIARSLVQTPKVILLDEPTANIDVKGQNEVYELLKELNKTIAIVVISHDISVSLGYAKNVAYINKSLVYHNLSDISKNLEIIKNGHLCEVELLFALGSKQTCGCSHG